MTSPPQVQAPAFSKSTLKFNQKKQKLVYYLEEVLHLTGIYQIIENNPLIDKTRFCIDTIDFVCKLIEDIVPKRNKDNIDKKALAVEILTDLYNLTDNDFLIIYLENQPEKTEFS